MKVLRLAAIGLGVAFGAFSKSHSPAGLTVHESPDRVVMRWSGPVEPPMLEKFERAFQQHEGDDRKIVISLNSGGGLVDHGYQVIALIRREARNHTIDTVVEAGRTCASMCVPIFLTGADRNADPAARFMFHEVSFRLPPSAEQKLRDLKRNAPTLDLDMIRKTMVVRATDEFYEEYFAPRGVNSRWLSDMRRNIQGRDIWRTGQQLVEQRSGVVDALK